MLQQTRVEAVKPYYDRFLEAFPTVEALAAAPEERVLKLWEGLGYYSRARNLQRAAQVVVERYQGQVPASFEALRSCREWGTTPPGPSLPLRFSFLCLRWTATCCGSSLGCWPAGTISWTPRVKRRMEGELAGVLPARWGTLINP